MFAQAIVRFLSMFLDGVKDEELPAQMLSLLNLSGIVDQVSSFVFLVACVKL